MWKGAILRWWRNRMGRPLSPPQINQKNIWMLSKLHKTTSELWQRTSGTQKSSPLSSKGDEWHLPGRLQPEISSTEETHGTLEMGAPTATQESEWLARGSDRMHSPPAESVLPKLLVAWTARTREGHTLQAQPSLCLCGVPENLNLSGLDLGSAWNPGPALDSSPAEQPGAWAV